MKLRSVVTVAALAMVLLPVAAKAAVMPITYDVDLTLDGGHKVTGFIKTDGVIGDLYRKDITDLYLQIGETFVDEADINRGNTYLEASATELTFVAGQSFINIFGQNGHVGTANLGLYSVIDFSFAQYTAPGGGIGYRLDSLTIPTGTNYVIGTVPLPASAPMFGAALLALGAVCYGLKRKTTAAS